MWGTYSVSAGKNHWYFKKCFFFPFTTMVLQHNLAELALHVQLCVPSDA